MNGRKEVLPPIPPEQWGDDEYAAFGALLGIPGERVPRVGSGERFDPLNFPVIGVLANNPRLAKAFLRFNGWQLQRASLPPRLRELAILRVAAAQRSAYEWSEHVRIANDIGVTADEIAALGRGNATFSGDDLLTLAAVDELLAAGRLSPARWAELDEALGTHAAMELIFVVGVYVTLAMAFDTFGLQPAPDAAPLPERPETHSAQTPTPAAQTRPEGSP